MLTSPRPAWQERVRQSSSTTRSPRARPQVWKERVGFARLAIQHGVPIIPFASVGVEDMFEIVLDAEDLLNSPVGALLRALRITEQPWFRHGEIIPPVARGTGPAGIPRIERQYFLFGEPIDPSPYAGLQQDREACYALRSQVKGAVEGGIEALREVREADPERWSVLGIMASFPAPDTDVERFSGRPSIHMVGSADEPDDKRTNGFDRFDTPRLFGVVQGMNHYAWTDEATESELYEQQSASGRNQTY